MQSGCGPAFNYGIITPHPSISPSRRNALQHADVFDANVVSEGTAISLDETSKEPDRSTLEEAKSVLNPMPDDAVVQLTLPEIRRDALQYNLNLQVDLHAPVIAAESFNSERWKFESVLGATQSQNISIDSFGGETDMANFDTTLRVPTRLGGIARIGLPFSRSDFDDAAFNLRTSGFGGRTDRTGFDLSLSQPLLRNAGADVNHASINVSGLLLMQADARTRLSAIRLLASAEQAYWSYFFAYENLAIQVRLYEVSKKQLTSSNRLVEEGVRTKAEIVRAESGVAQRYEQVIAAELNRRLAERSLKRIMNSPRLPTNGGTSIIPNSPPDPRGFEFNREEVVSLALGNRVELIENEFQQDIDRINIEVNKNAILPDVRFDFRYSFAGEGDTYNQSIDKLFEPESDSYSFGFTSDLPVQGNQAARARHRQSRWALSQTQAFQRAITLTITEESLNAVDSVEKIWQRIVANRLFVDTARKSYENELTQFEKGETTNTDVFVQLSSLAQAEQQLVLSLSDYQRSLVDLAFATGTVLGQSGVVYGCPTPVPAHMEAGRPVGLQQPVNPEGPGQLVPVEAEDVSQLESSDPSDPEEIPSPRPDEEPRLRQGEPAVDEADRQPIDIDSDASDASDAFSELLKEISEPPGI
ncbi:MAG: TolC family protein [Rubripirellula sp.]